MSSLIQFLGAVAMAMAAAAGAAVLVILGVVESLRRRARVSARATNRVPVHWLLSPTRPALLHRRVRRAVLAIRDVVPQSRRRRATTPIQDMADNIEDLAADLSRGLVLASRASRSDRRYALADLARQVASIESMSARLVRVATELGDDRTDGANWVDRSAAVDLRIRAHEEALADLARLDATIEWFVPDAGAAVNEIPTHSSTPTPSPRSTQLQTGTLNSSPSNSPEPRQRSMYSK